MYTAATTLDKEDLVQMNCSELSITAKIAISKTQWEHKRLLLNLKNLLICSLNKKMICKKMNQL